MDCFSVFWLIKCIVPVFPLQIQTKKPRKLNKETYRNINLQLLSRHFLLANWKQCKPLNQTQNIQNDIF